MNISLNLSSNIIEVNSPFTGEVVGTAKKTSSSELSDILKKAKVGVVESASLPRYFRAKVLEDTASLIEADLDEFAHLIVMEAGKTITQAKKEVRRCINTLKLSAEEAKRNAGEVIPFDAYEGSENRTGWFSREPLGLIIAITPYNDPLNLVAHKLGPAIAGGNAIILKPSELTPLSAIKLVNYLIEAGLPPNIVNIVVGDSDLGRELVSIRDARMVSFTGGFKTGENISKNAGLKKLSMDLGGNAPVIVLPDCDLAYAVEACVSGAFWAAGQNCIGTQRILVHQSIYDEFKYKFTELTKKLVVGNPSHHETDVGPMINETAAIRAEQLVSQAIARGARLLCGHLREGTLYHPTVLENVSHDIELWGQEAFAPIVLLESFNDFDNAILSANAPEYSLHAGVFTKDMNLAMKFAREIQAGGIMINDSSDYRFDAMPFGGFKYGSLGREGVRFAYEEMTQPKVICLNHLN